MSMSDILCSWTDLEAQHCDGEEFQPKHPGVLSEKVMLLGSAHAMTMHVGFRGVGAWVRGEEA